MTAPHLLLVGMTVTDVHARTDIAALATSRGGSLCFLQQATPALTDELTLLADAGAVTVRVVGVSTASRSPAPSWLRRVAGHWSRERVGHRPVIEVATSVVRTDLSPEALDTALENTRAIHGREAPLVSDAWEHVPGHRHHVLVCRGPRCSARGAATTAAAIDQSLRQHGLGDDDVLVTQTGCLFPCNHAPVVCVHPADAWYACVDPDVGRALVDTHLVAGRPLETNLLPRGPEPRGRP